jgi:Fe-S-cluster containining protein
MTPVPEIANNERPDLCAACGGACCRTRPGIEAPARFLTGSDPTAALAQALASGAWVLAEHVGVPWTNGVPPPDEDRYRVLRYPRPATLSEQGLDAALASDDAGACAFLDPGGCRLAFEDRPRMCRSLEPAADGECVAAWDRRAAALAWLPHQDLVAAALALGRRLPDAQEPRR